MALDLIPPPTIAQTQAALENLPEGLAVTGITLLSAPGITADSVLTFADALDAGATQQDMVCRGDHLARDMRRLAAILRDAAPRYPHPPRLPISAEAADASVRRRAVAAGLSTACIRADDQTRRYPNDWDMRGDHFIGGEP